jgi:hypothetical protein
VGRVAHGQAAISQGPIERKAGRDRDLERTPLRRDQDQGVAEQVDPAAGVDGAAAFQLVHPRRVGRQIEVRRRTLGDLARQGRGGRKHGPHLGAAARLVGARHGGDRIDRARRREQGQRRFRARRGGGR